jgi:hypothetical protein
MQAPRTPAQQQRAANAQKRPAAQKDARKIWEEYSDGEAWPEILGVTAEQWQVIKPKLDKIKQLRMMPGIMASVYGFGGSSNSFSREFRNGSTGGARGAVSGGSFGGSAGGFGGGSGGASYGAAGGTGGGGGLQQSSGARAAVGASGIQGEATASGGGASGGGGYSFGFGGPPGPVKKTVGELSLGWQWPRPSQSKTPDKLTEGEKACEQLLDALEAKNPDQVRQRLEALRQMRAQRLAERQETQRQLRELVTSEQETKLVLMGYLD